MEEVYENGKITYVSSLVTALGGANICFVFTEWKEMKVPEYEKLMQPSLVYDGRNIYKSSDMKKEGVE